MKILGNSHMLWGSGTSFERFWEHDVVRICEPLFLWNDVLGLFLVGQEVAKKSDVFFFEISFSEMCNLYNIHQASDCHKGFINILSNFLRDESGPEPPMTTRLRNPTCAANEVTNPFRRALSRDFQVLGVSHSHDPEPSKT